MYCISWLRARDLDIKKATDMFRSNLAWRESEDIDNILDWEPPSHFPTDYDYEIVGEDGEGRPSKSKHQSVHVHCQPCEFGQGGLLSHTFKCGNF